MANLIPFKEWTRRGKWWPTLSFRGPSDGVVVHHSVTRPVQSPTQSARVVEEVIYQRRWESRFSMIAYSFLLHPDGTILEGRGGYGGFRNGANKNTKSDSPPLGNANTVSVCLIGDMRVDKVTQQQRASFQWLLEDLERRNVIRRNALVVPHNEVSHTQCPAFNVDDLLVPSAPSTDGEEGDGMKIINDTEAQRMWASWVHEGTTTVREYHNYRGANIGDVQPGIGYVIDQQIAADMIRNAS